MEKEEVLALGINCKIGADEASLLNAMAKARPIIEEREKSAPPATKQNTKQNTKLDVEAETLREARLLPEHESQSGQYDTWYADETLRYVFVNQSQKIGDKMNLRNPDFYRKMGYGHVDIKVSESKLLRLVWRPGHPQNPNGAEQIGNPNQVLMAISWATWVERDLDRIEKGGFNPELEYAGDRHITPVDIDTMPAGRGIVVPDNRYVKDHGHVTADNLPEHLPNAAARKRRDAVVNRGKQALGEVNEMMESKSGKTLSDAIAEEFESRGDPLAG